MQHNYLNQSFLGQNLSGTNRMLPLLVMSGIVIAIIIISMFLRSQYGKNQGVVLAGVRGDANADGKLSFDDPAYIRTLMVEQEYKKQADLNNDGTITSQDIEIFYAVLSFDH